ncbi:hypothetical protein [Streptomyces sp. NPDC002343]
MTVPDDAREWMTGFCRDDPARQPRGAAVNQVLAALRTLVTAGAGVPASGLVPTADG